MTKTKKTVYRLKSALADIRPPIWRRVEVEDCTLLRLHEIIQIVMGWEFSHLWAFEIDGVQFGDDSWGEMDMESAQSQKLSRVVNSGITKFGYLYDFGDSWQHVITVEKTVDTDLKVKYPRCVAGKRACPPEDCGGPWSYGDFLKAIQDPKHDEHEDLLEWVGGEFDPERFDVDDVNKELASIR